MPRYELKVRFAYGDKFELELEQAKSWHAADLESAMKDFMNRTTMYKVDEERTREHNMNRLLAGDNDDGM